VGAATTAATNSPAKDNSTLGVNDSECTGDADNNADVEEAVDSAGGTGGESHDGGSDAGGEDEQWIKAMPPELALVAAANALRKVLPTE